MLLYAIVCPCSTKEYIQMGMHFGVSPFSLPTVWCYMWDWDKGGREGCEVFSNMFPSSCTNDDLLKAREKTVIAHSRIV